MTLGLLSVSVEKASANILTTAIEKIKILLNASTSSSKEEMGIYIEPQENDDYVLRTNSKNIVERNSSNTKMDILEDGEILNVAVGPVRTTTDEELNINDTIQVYEVKKGDTLADIAKLYNVSKNTIVWANDIKKGKVDPGEILIILPVSGVKHIVKKGDTVKSISKKYKADEQSIIEFNSIVDGNMAIGDELIIPDGQMYIDAPVTKKQTKPAYTGAVAGYYTRPILGGIKTQGRHGRNAVDIGAPIGSTVVAAAAGTIQVAKKSGYNGGYGSMIIISHGNGTQTVYAHLNNVYVNVGQQVSKGEHIGASGNTGKSTGPHLHFEVRGASNPF
jgi:LysM repeat protein